MKYVSVRNFERFQHYRDRRPLWVKLYLSITRDGDFGALSPTARLVYLLMLAIAADRDNKVPNDPSWLAVEMTLPRPLVSKSLAELLDASYLIRASEAASKPASESAPSHARPRARGETETETEKEPNGSLPTRPRNEIWDALVEVFGEPSTDTARSLRGKVCASLTRAGATPDELIARAKSWPRHFEDATLTETALEKHWDKLGRPPLRAAR